MEEMRKYRIKCVDAGTPDFPEKLKKLPGMPKKLYYRGNLPDFFQTLCCSYRGKNEQPIRKMPGFSLRQNHVKIWSTDYQRPCQGN